MQEDRDIGSPTTVSRACCIEGSKEHADDAMPPTLSREWNLPSRLHIMRGDENRSIQSKRKGRQRGSWKMGSMKERGWSYVEVGDKRSKKDVWITECGGTLQLHGMEHVFLPTPPWRRHYWRNLKRFLSLNKFINYLCLIKGILKF